MFLQLKSLKSAIGCIIFRKCLQWGNQKPMDLQHSKSCKSRIFCEKMIFLICYRLCTVPLSYNRTCHCKI